MLNNRYGYLIAAIWIVALDAILAWWVKGDLEMAWLVGMPVIVGGGVVIGVVPAVAFRRWKPALISIGASVLLSALLLYAAIETPHHWKAAPPTDLVDAVNRFASDRAQVKSASEKVTGYPVEPAIPAQVELTGGVTTKEGFSFSLSRRPAAARVVVAFEAGPSQAMQFDEVRGSGSWQMRPRKSDVERITIRPAAFERRFPDSRVIEVGGSGPYSAGQSLAVRAARSETDWSIVLLRLMDGGQTVREVRRYSQTDLLARFRGTLAASGLTPLETAVIYFRPVKQQDVMFLQSPEFSFIGVLGDARYWRAEIVARLSRDGGGIDFEVGRKLTRPPAGTVFAGDRR
ncbi:MAG TPA: hypothetical protein VN428_12225 [Bryobacteraceae bacterium]|nr:hypothetical protein [Bryobacteraceae bacterium]